MINLDHVHFQNKTVIYFVQTFGNIYTIVPFYKHALCVFHAIAWLILLAHAQTNFPPVVMIHLQAKTTCVPTTSESDCRLDPKVEKYLEKLLAIEIGSEQSTYLL
jgi:hypothetical protein